MEKQIHSKFKLFVGAADNKGVSKKLVTEIKKFSDAHPHYAPKSIGVEFLDDSKEVIITLGYAEDKKANYKISLEASDIGPVSKKTIAALEGTLEKVAKKHKNVICHELFINHNGQMFAVFLTAVKR